jgi:uncharacterized protein (DUF433 family)
MVFASIDPHDGLRTNEQIGKIDIRDHVCGGDPCISGTRIMVRSIKSFATAGYPVHAILRQYPVLVAEDVDAALQYEVK